MAALGCAERQESVWQRRSQINEPEGQVEGFRARVTLF